MMNGDRSIAPQERDETGQRHSAADARGGEIILRTRRRRVIFIGGLIAWGVAMLLAPLFF